MAGERRHVFICHASEDKADVVRPLVEALTDAEISYWYDEAEIIWGDSITERVNQGLEVSKYVLVVLSESFISKNWPQRELHSALSIEARSGDVRVLPLLVGSEATIKGLIEKYPILNDKSYLKWGGGISKIIESLKARLSASAGSSEDESRRPEDKSSDIPLPEIKKKFTQRDKDLFLKNSFDAVRSYFKKALANLEAKYPEVETDLTEIHSFKFTNTVYIHGEAKTKCKIWLGGPFGADSIAYASGHVDIDSDSSCNGWLTVSDKGRSLGFAASDMPFQSTYSENNKILTPEQAAECLWQWFTEILDQKQENV